MALAEQEVNARLAALDDLPDLELFLVVQVGQGLIHVLECQEEALLHQLLALRDQIRLDGVADVDEGDLAVDEKQVLYVLDHVDVRLQGCPRPGRLVQRRVRGVRPFL